MRHIFKNALSEEEHIVLEGGLLTFYNTGKVYPG